MICRCEIEYIYNRVFDENGEIKACGREVCKTLINVINQETSVYVGNPETGMMDIDNIKAEYKKIMEKTVESSCGGI